MAAVNGVNAALVATGGIATIGRGLIDARVKCMIDSYALTTGNLSGDVITVGGTIPVGANIVAIVLMASAAQTSLTISVGDAASATRYLSAGTGLQTAVTPVIVDGKGYVVTGTNDTQIKLTTGGATATAGTLYVKVFYTQD